MKKHKFFGEDPFGTSFEFSQEFLDEPIGSKEMRSISHESRFDVSAPNNDSQETEQK